ncbi:hypothetical protein DH2020_048109 [Rehmannia glutinosa]|uniref:BRCT domain-containing protein n=1 Tax=Rehmannia glutinosa TaxID=99300 RepID=A0ABR0U7I9_REHGL
MQESKQFIAYDDPAKTFLGVRFILLGFDSIKEEKVRLKLLEGGGIDAVNYGPDCNHVIVDKLVYDDPMCAAAHRDGKTLVTGLWVDHSFDVGMPVDPTSVVSLVMYRPMRDLNGIPGAKSLVVCLTGYQRQDRDDIMTMVALMGANFSKPLVANKVTHLICYKFEGEKYELAKKMKKIKLVNHRWLEDCLKSWELLPEADYSKSGYELEMMAEAKDSEEETEDMASTIALERKNVVSPQNTRAENKSFFHHSPFKQEILRNSLHLSASTSLANVVDTSKIQQTPGKVVSYERASFSRETHNKHLKTSSSCRTPGKMSSEEPSNIIDRTNISEKQEFLRSTPGKHTPPLKSDTIRSCSGSPASNIKKHGVTGGFDMPLERFQDGTDYGVKTPSKETLPHLNEGQTAKLSNKSKTSVSRGSSKSPMLSRDPKLSIESKLAMKTTDLLASGSSVDGLRGEEASVAPKEAQNISLTSDSRKGLKKQTSSNLDLKDLSSNRTNNSTGGVEMHQSDIQSIEPPFERINSGIEKTDGHQADLNTNNLQRSTTKLKGSLNKAILQNECVTHPNGTVSMEDTDNATIADKVINEGEGDINSEKEVTPMKEKVAKSVGGKKSIEASKAAFSKKTKSTVSKSKGDAGEEKLAKGKKRPLATSTTNKLKDSGKKVKNDEKQDDKKSVSGNEETVVLAGKTKTRPSKKLKSSADVEKENTPATVMQQSVSNNTVAIEKVASERNKKPIKNGFKVEKINLESVKRTHDLEVKTEPACFILSGHRLQRKDFQQLIRRLKGRVCRDSHHWSYQATHFIVPDPVRRTEKFFAAAASGSWILKTDYLTASNESGRFLSEEPYEWHKKCLTEDGAINLEAPRKWRLLRERTGHGAFYGMRVVIYGECIAPPLDTLKRVIKAGDGTILATSPPYTRFFQSRIDFAIVSPGMPRVDMWVQEFLRHEVPCVVADYLVEYVCKPGYPLERHVQYNTHAWAQKSLENMVNRVEEVVEDMKTPQDHGIDDVACQVCGSRDRGEEMLICGDESGSCGCGVGTHFDCLDPPLEDVPEEDWFCPECSIKRKSKTTSQRSNKRASKSKK